MVLNPYTLLSLLAPAKQLYTVLDLKDAFFSSIPLARQSQTLFVFKWTNLGTGSHGQLTQIQLPRAFKNSPTFFNEAFHADLGEQYLRFPQVTPLQYVDDLLIAGEDETSFQEATEGLLQTLQTMRYRVSARMAKCCTRTDTTWDSTSTKVKELCLLSTNKPSWGS